MTTVTHALEDARVFYRDIKPYEAPARLDDLHGPATGTMTLPINVYWGPWAEVDLDIASDVIKAYQATLREGRVTDQVTLVNGELLVRVWADLLLPVRVRELWESRFPELTARA